MASIFKKSFLGCVSGIFEKCLLASCFVIGIFTFHNIALAKPSSICTAKDEGRAYECAILKTCNGSLSFQESLEDSIPPCKESGPLLAEETILPSSSDFDHHVEYAAKRSRPGYVFKITLVPKKTSHFRRMNHHLFFLIDRSHSIVRYRFAQMKEAVSEALSLLHPGDTFNIFFFDDRNCKLSPENLSWNSENVAKARYFLERQSHGGHFTSTDLYAVLGKIIPKAISDEEVNTAILLSDGDTFLSEQEHRRIISSWTNQNQGKVTLFSIASGIGNNLALLDLLTDLNKGKLLYTTEHDQVKDRLFHLLKTIQYPIGKIVSATVITEDKKMHVLLQPKSHRLPNLYWDSPFVIYGSTNRLSEFILCLQGKFYDQNFDIQKKICLKEAHQGTLSLEKEWTQLLALDYYEKFLKQGNESHCEIAKELLNSLNLPCPFSPKF